MGDLGPTIDDLIKQSKTSKTSQSDDDKDDKGSKKIKVDKKKSAKDYDTVTGKFERRMEKIKLTEKEKETAVKAQGLGVLYLDLAKYSIPPETLASIDEDTANQLKTVCFYRDIDKIKIASLNPKGEKVRELVETIKLDWHVKDIEMYLISQNSFKKLIYQYKYLPKIKDISTGVSISEEDLDRFKANIGVIKDLQKILERANISEIVTAIISLSLQIKSSDIHVEAEEKDVMIRYRVDGILNEAATLEKDKWQRITNRIKLLSGLKLNVTNKPQDGRFTIFMKDDKVDVRVSVIPTTFGESIVMRLLRSSAAGLEFEKLGVQGNAYEDLVKQITKPNGMIITTGPTGSGKTTTLYSILSKLNSEETKIITLEDPVEYKLEGINQSQIDHSKGYSFADGLRSILRQDPDIVMVGEIRDLETAEVAINASLTGHLVISTLHTNSAAAALPRFISMGVKSFLLSPSLNAIIGQRLVRRLCQDCKKVEPIDEKTLKAVQEVMSKISEKATVKVKVDEITKDSFFRGAGCEECHGIGYKGRLGIYEILTMNKEIEEKLLTEQLSEYVFEEIAIRHGMVTMVQDGIIKALQGITALDEVFRVAKALE